MGTFSQIKPALRTENITYAVRDIVVLANEVAKKGKKMLYLNIGDPNIFDFQTPAHIIEATYQAMRANMNGYSPSSGIKEALGAIEGQACAKGIENILDIFITTGVSEAIDICFTALVNHGENVLTPTPRYPLYSAILNKLGARLNPYYLDEKNEWQPDLEDISSKIDGKTRGIVLINPNNPTGSVCTEQTMRGIIRLALEHNLVVFADEIYDKLLLDEGRHISIASLDRDVSVITFNGLSKAYVVPGFRLGWAVVSGRTEVLGEYVEAINKLLRARLCANHPEQYAIKAALEGDQSHLDQMRTKLRHRRDMTYEMLNSCAGISCVKPRGAFYAFPRLEIEGSDASFVRELITQTGVVVVPGSGFGQAPGTRHFRVVFLPPEDVLKEAYTKISQFLDTYIARQ